MLFLHSYAAHPWWEFDACFHRWKKKLRLRLSASPSPNLCWDGFFWQMVSRVWVHSTLVSFQGAIQMSSPVSLWLMHPRLPSLLSLRRASMPSAGLSFPPLTILWEQPLVDSLDCPDDSFFLFSTGISMRFHPHYLLNCRLWSETDFEPSFILAWGRSSSSSQFSLEWARVVRYLGWSPHSCDRLTYFRWVHQGLLCFRWSRCFLLRSRTMVSFPVCSDSHYSSRLLAFLLQASERDLGNVLVLDSAKQSFHCYCLHLFTAAPTTHTRKHVPSTQLIHSMDLFKAGVCYGCLHQRSASNHLKDK